MRPALCPDLACLVSCDRMWSGTDLFRSMRFRSCLTVARLLFLFGSGQHWANSRRTAMLAGKMSGHSGARLFYRLGLDFDSGHTLSCVQFEPRGVRRRGATFACARRPRLARPGPRRLVRRATGLAASRVTETNQSRMETHFSLSMASFKVPLWITQVMARLCFHLNHPRFKVEARLWL